MEYKILVKDLQVHESIGQWSNVVYQVNCTYEGSGEYTKCYLDFDCDIYDSASMSLDQVPGYVFTPFSDLTQDQIVGWVEQSNVDFSSLQNEVSTSLAISEVKIKEVEAISSYRPNLPWMQ
jgi:hypothetical protein